MSAKHRSAAEELIFEAFELVSASDIAEAIGHDGVAVEYGIYEVGTDCLVRVCHSPSKSLVSERCIDSNHVVALMLTARQWEIPPDLRGADLDEHEDEAISSAAHRKDAALTTRESLEMVVLNQSYKDPWLLAHSLQPSEEAMMRRQVIASMAASALKAKNWWDVLKEN